MNSDDFGVQFDRVAAQFRLPSTRVEDRVTIFTEWFTQLRHYHIDAVEAGVTALIGQAKDTFWPALGALKELIQARIDRFERHRGGCDTCHDSTWIDDIPRWSQSRTVYVAMRRCPDCGTPPPNYKPGFVGEPLMAVEVVAWRQGTLEERRIELKKPTRQVIQIKRLEMAKFQNPLPEAAEKPNVA